MQTFDFALFIRDEEFLSYLTRLESFGEINS
jgi:hypothetical protein